MGRRDSAFVRYAPHRLTLDRSAAPHGPPIALELHTVTKPARKLWQSTLRPSQLIEQARNWRQTFEHPFAVDAWDPVSRLIRDRLGWDWPQVWFFALLIYGPLEKLLIPYLGGYLVLGTNVRGWRPDVEALLTGFVEFPFFWAFYLWTGRGIGVLFTSLARNKSFADEQRYAAFRDRAQSAFDRWWWTLISFVLAIVVVLLMHLVNWKPDAPIPPWFIDGGSPARLLSLFLIGCVAYALAQILIREILTIVWLRRLWNELGDQLVVHPYHADRAGGLGAIGQHAANFAVFVMMVLLFVIMATLLPTIRDADVPIQLWSPLIVVVWALCFTLIPAIFFMLIWPPHKTMSRVCSARLNVLSAEIEEQLRAAEASATTDQVQLPQLLEKVTQLKALHGTLQSDLPDWPINARIRTQLRFSSLLPVVYSLITLALDRLL